MSEPVDAGRTTSRRQRQADELSALCRGGAVSRAVDLAFDHFAAFGCDDSIVELLADAVDRTPVAGDLHRRLAELRGTPR